MCHFYLFVTEQPVFVMLTRREETRGERLKFRPLIPRFYIVIVNVHSHKKKKKYKRNVKVIETPEEK